MSGGLSVLYLTKYDVMGASSRYRFLQFFPELERAGIRCTASPLFDDAYLKRRYLKGGGSLLDFSRALWRRLAVLATVRRYDLVVIEKELFPYLPPCLESLLARLGVRYLAEYDDALFHQYDQSPSRLVRTLLANKIAAVMRNSAAVIAGNGYLADYARLCGAQRIEILPTVVDLARYPLQGPAQNEVFTIGWIGSPSTAAYLADIAPALAEVCRGGKGRVSLIGAGALELPGVPVQIVPWSAEAEVAELCKLDAGIMPLPDTPWARGKCGFKLVQYMACGLPVVASPVGVNGDIVEHGRNGFLAHTREEWVEALGALQRDKRLRVELGRAGREKVEKQYCSAVVAPELVRIIRESSRKGAGPGRAAGEPA